MYNLQLPHTTSNLLMVATVMVIRAVVVNMVAMVDRTGQK